jgi:hypothetical protein
MLPPFGGNFKNMILIYDNRVVWKLRTKGTMFLNNSVESLNTNCEKQQKIARHFESVEKPYLGYFVNS